MKTVYSNNDWTMFLRIIDMISRREKLAKSDKKSQGEV